VATGSALTHFTFVAHFELLPIEDKSFALAFIVPTNAPGVKFICRVSNEQRAAILGSPFDYPLSSRLDENDAIFIMDDVFVPWEDVFVYGDIEKANSFFPRSGFVPRFQLQGCTRLAAKLDFITGLLIKATEMAGTRVRGSGGAAAVERVKLMKLLWDAVGTEFAGRHERYEINYSGSHEEIRRYALQGAVASGQYERWKSFADSCMAEYDLDGWTVPDLVDPRDVTVLRS
jgi:aromatic ring hydroxylase